MDMKLRPFDFAQAAARAGLAVNGTPLSAKPVATTGASFGDAMTQALKVPHFGYADEVAEYGAGGVGISRVIHR